MTIQVGPDGLALRTKAEAKPALLPVDVASSLSKQNSAGTREWLLLTKVVC